MKILHWRIFLQSKKTGPRESNRNYLRSFTFVGYFNPPP